jgi:hypothetical protein
LKKNIICNKQHLFLTLSACFPAGPAPSHGKLQFLFIVSQEEEGGGTSPSCIVGDEG